MKLLGYKQIEVRMMAVNDAEHQLNLEISENEVRKEFSRLERLDYARRLERIERVKAEERMKNPMENFPQGSEGATRDKVAKKIGIGSGKQYEKEKFISENADEETLKAWDEGDISTNRAYQKILKEKEKAEQENKKLKEDLKLSEEENIQKSYDEKLEKEIEIIEKRYNKKHKKEMLKVQNKIKELEKKVLSYETEEDLNKRDAEEYKTLKDQILKLKLEKDSFSRQIDSITELSGLIVRTENFFKNEFAPIKYSRAIREQRQHPVVQRNLKYILNTIQEWLDEMYPLVDGKNYVDVEVKKNAIKLE